MPFSQCHQSRPRHAGATIRSHQLVLPIPAEKIWSQAIRDIKPRHLYTSKVCVRIFFFFVLSWETKKEWKITLSYHFHSNVTRKVMNGAQREIKGMWCYFKEISIALTKQALMYWISLLYWSSSTQKHGDIGIHQKTDWKRNGEKKAVYLGEIEKREGH